MTGKRIWKVVFALVVVAVLAFGSIALYRLGFAHGAMTNFSFPEGSEFPMMPYAHQPLMGHYGPRVGLLGLLPLLCFGGFFILFLLGGFGFCARRRAWRHYAAGHPDHWKHHGAPWGPDCASWEQKQSEGESKTSSAKTDQTEG